MQANRGHVKGCADIRRGLLCLWTPGTAIVGARFHPGLAPGLLGLPASELLNQYVDLSVITGSAATAGFERVGEGRSLVARRLAMEAALLGRMASAKEADQSVT